MEHEPFSSAALAAVTLREVPRSSGAPRPDRAYGEDKTSRHETDLELLKRLLGALARHALPRPHLRWINASIGSQVRLVSVDEVLYFQADMKYTRVVTADAALLIRKSLRELQEELDPATYWPIHRSTIVNAGAISVVSRDRHGRLWVALKRHDDKLSVSEAHAHLFRQM